MLERLIAKTPGKFLPGVFLCLAILPVTGKADCGFPDSPPAIVAKVVDGDTLKLEDGRSVRVLGINAPEIAVGSKRGQPLGKESLANARRFVNQADNKVRLGFDAERRDHYGRWLAHVYDGAGRSLAVEQLRFGMAMRVSVSPNNAQDACLSSVENLARKQVAGLWRNAYWNAYPASSLVKSDTGFRLVRGQVTRVDINSSAWLEFDGQLVVRIKKNDWPAYGLQANSWRKLQGKTLEVRGWIRSRKASGQAPGKRQFKPLMMVLDSPSSLKVFN